MSKVSLQEHINQHVSNAEINNVELKQFYADYVLLRPDIDPFLTFSTSEDSGSPSNTRDYLVLNNNNNSETNLNFSETGSNLTTGSLDEIELEHLDVLNIPEGPVYVDNLPATCCKQEPSSSVNRHHYRCTKCDNLFLSVESFEGHLNNRKCYIIGKCSLCDCYFSNNNDYYNHIIQAHSRQKRVCNFCFKIFVRYKNLMKHIISTHHYC